MAQDQLIAGACVVAGILMVIASIMGISRRRIALGRHGRMIEYTGPQAIYYGIAGVLLGVAVLVGVCIWFWTSH